MHDRLIQSEIHIDGNRVELIVTDRRGRCHVERGNRRSGGIDQNRRALVDLATPVAHVIAGGKDRIGGPARGQIADVEIAAIEEIALGRQLDADRHPAIGGQAEERRGNQRFADIHFHIHPAGGHTSADRIVFTPGGIADRQCPGHQAVGHRAGGVGWGADGVELVQGDDPVVEGPIHRRQVGEPVLRHRTGVGLHCLVDGVEGCGGAVDSIGDYPGIH
ncbi:MAG: hypothetical protein JAZ17_22150 [Candidatus Thiodiazotropha endolucinida]|nr:hypothetical protein [Candidatus Thiodiazotropha endolucinida]